MVVNWPWIWMWACTIILVCVYWLWWIGDFSTTDSWIEAENVKVQHLHKTFLVTQKLIWEMPHFTVGYSYGCGKILYFTKPDYSLRFMDSLSFLSMRLSAMSKALGFCDQSKGYFPHKFLLEQNLTYIGKFPSRSDYYVEKISPTQQDKFCSWCRQASQNTFNFKKEAL